MQFRLNVFVPLEDCLFGLRVGIDELVNFVEFLHGFGVGALQFEQTGFDAFVVGAVLAQLLQIESIQILVLRLISDSHDAVGVPKDSAQKLIECVIRIANNQYLRVCVH